MWSLFVFEVCDTLNLVSMHYKAGGVKCHGFEQKQRSTLTAWHRRLLLETPSESRSRCIKQ